MLSLYQSSCLECSKLITNRYSTSFSLGIKMFAKPLRNPIYSIYGFVRFADEIVDTFHEWDKAKLLDEFEQDTFAAIKRQISLNPILQSFQEVVNEYAIDHDLIKAFLRSMRMDLTKTTFDDTEYQDYIYGSAEVIGLMCLRVFVKGDDHTYNHLKASACSLGSAFQKVNFLRDLKSDFVERGRVYFPGVNYADFSCHQKNEIVNDIEKDFKDAMIGIKQLPDGARQGVYIAYMYYLNLLKRIEHSPAHQIKSRRIRVPDLRKASLLLSSSLRYRLGLM